MTKADDERRIDALFRAIINAIKYTAKEWDLKQRDVITALQDVKDHVAKLFLDANRDVNRKPDRRDAEENDDE